MNIDNKLFPPDKDWLQDTYKDMREIFGSAEYFSQYLKKRFPSMDDNEIEGIRSHFIVDKIDVDFVPVEDCPRKIVKVGYGSASLQVLIPDHPGLSPAEKEKIRDHYQGFYFNRLKEGHIRINALLWYLLPDDKKAEIQQHFPDEIDIDDLELFSTNKQTD